MRAEMLFLYVAVREKSLLNGGRGSVAVASMEMPVKRKISGQEEKSK